MSVFNDQTAEQDAAEKQKELLSEPEEKKQIFDSMNQEQIMLLIYGAMTIVGTFIFFVFFSLKWLLLPMIAGVLMLLDPLTGIAPEKTLAKKLAKKEEEE